MKAQLQALTSKLKSFGSKVGDKIDEATMSEHELRQKHGVEETKSDTEKMSEVKEATTLPKVAPATPATDSSKQVYERPAPAVMKVGRRIIK